MKLHRHSPVGARARVKSTRAACGLTLVEMAMAVGVGSLVLVIVGTLTVYALRSFAAMGNYASLDARNRIALDKITRDIRQATCVTNCYSDSTVKWIRFVTPYGESPTTKYTWYPDDRTLVCEKGGQEEIYLTDCDQWDFAFYKRTPQPTFGNVFLPATNSAGEYDLSICKMIGMSWKCSRTLAGKKWNSESVQSVQIVLRNKQ